MVAICEHDTLSNIEQSIWTHSAFYSHISALNAEELLRNQEPYTYLLRAGENEHDYYVTSIQPNGSIHHQPFVISNTSKGWCYENSSPGGPFIDATIDDVLHLIMHCHVNENTPLIASA